MLNTYRKRQKNSTPLYEQNYQRLLGFLPDLRRVPFWNAFDKHGQIELQVQTLEKFAYTTLLSIRLTPLTEISVAADCEMIIRICHDARVAEVVGFQGHAKFQHYYNYPNLHMYQPDEKRQVNAMLSDMLNFCLQSGFAFQQVA